MNASNKNHDPNNSDDLHDHLLDVALAELVGGATPPDLSARIAAATSRQPAAITQAPRTRQDRAFWARLALAATLLIGVTVVLFANGQHAGKQLVATVDRSTPPATAQSTKIAAETVHKKKIAELVEEFNRLNHEQRYAESEVAARRLVELAPQDPVAQQVWQNSKFIHREMLGHQVVDNKENSVWEQLNSVEESAINPTPANRPRFAGANKLETMSVAETAARPSGQLMGPEGGPSTYNLALDASGARSPSTYGFDGPSGRAWAGSGNTPESQNTGLRGLINDSVASDGQVGRGSYSKTIAANTTTPQSQTVRKDRYGNMDLVDNPDNLATNLNTARTSDDVVGLEQKKTLLKAYGGSRATTIDHLAKLNTRRERESVEGTHWAIRDSSPEPSAVANDGKELAYNQNHWKELAPKRDYLFRSGDKYNPIVENQFIKAEGGDAVSTLSIDVDTASYANIRQFLLQMNQLPPANAVRIEELINYFHYDYAGPKPSDEAPFAAHVEVTACPWSPEHRLARIGIKGREMDRTKRPQSNLVFLVDVSGSMNEPAKLPLVVYGLQELTRELGENDHIAIVVYAGTEGVVLPSISGSKQDTILAALGKLQAGGSTAGGAGIQLAYQIAEDNFIKGGTNRVILCTDGDFNVGVTDTAELQRMVEQKAKETGVFISTLGFGRGNLNDAMMVAISDHGNGNYHYIDSRSEARRVLVEEMTGTLVTIAKDVKIQVEFNPAQVASYRLIGYEKRMLKTEDFNNDKKDAGEIGAGHTVTALYEIVPAGKKVDTAVDDLKYQKAAEPTESNKQKVLLGDGDATKRELLTLKMRYKAPDGDTSKKLEWPVTDEGKSFSAASADLKFATSVAGFGLMLRNSQFKGNLTYAAVEEVAQSSLGEDPHGYRKEFLDMVRKAKELRHE